MARADLRQLIRLELVWLPRKGLEMAEKVLNGL